jgi:alkaline phosphatase
MAKNVILMIGDGMGWEMSRAGAIQKQIEQEIAQIRTENPQITNEQIAARFDGRTLKDYYLAGKGAGTSYQNLTGYTIATTGNTYIDGSKSNSALQNNPDLPPNVFHHNTGQAKLRPGFEFDPRAAKVQGFTIKSATTPQIAANQSIDLGFNEAPMLDETGQMLGGNIPIFDREQGGQTPWDANYYKHRSHPGKNFNPDYIKNLYPDSAATATGIYTGVKTYVGAVSVDIYEQEIETAAEVARDSGKSIGVVSSVPFNHATPGSAIAHVNHRDKYNEQSFDEQVGNGDGSNSNEVDEFGHKISDFDNIFYQIVNESKPTVILGGGHYLTSGGTEEQPHETYVTKAQVENLRQGKYDYTFVERGTNASQVLADTAAKLDPEAGDRLFGIYGARGQGGNLPWRTANDDYSRTGQNSQLNPATGLVELEQPVLANGASVKNFIAQEINENPTLKEFTQASLDVLEDDQDGFWLMVEGGDIDWSAHGNDLDNLLGNLKDFDESVAVVQQWISNHGGYEENLLIVTADHDHYLTLTNNFPELLADALLTGQGGAELTTANVAAAGHFWGSNASVKNGWSTHTSRPVPVYFQGADSEIISTFEGSGYKVDGHQVAGVDTFIDQTHLGTVQRQALTTKINQVSMANLGFGWQWGLILLLLVGLGAGIFAQVKSKNS